MCDALNLLFPKSMCWEFRQTSFASSTFSTWFSRGR
jgi:hypothetical protein